MSGEYLTIGEMARINHTTIPTLRLYDSFGLLKPAYTNPVSRYRYYTIRQNAHLDIIQYMKELGMGLKEIKEVFAKRDFVSIEDILNRKQELILKNIEQLQLQYEAIGRTIESVDRYRKSPHPGTITLEYVKKRRIYPMKTGVNFYDHSIDTYELILKQLKDDMISHHLPQIYYCNAGTFLARDNFLQQKFVSDTIFVFVDQHFPLQSACRTIDSGMYACVYLDDFDAEKEYASRLLAYCRAQQYEITGDYICEVLAEFFSEETRNMFLRLQVPVAFSRY